MIAQVQMSSPQRDLITLLCAHRAPCIYLYSISSRGFYNDLFKHLSLPLDCGLLKGRQPVWLTIYFYLLAQSLAHDGPVLKELLLPAVPYPSCTQPCLSWIHSDQHFFILAFVKINGLFYIYKSWGHILHPYINSSISPHQITPPSWYKFSHGFWTTTLSFLHLAHWLLLLSLFWWFLFLPVL